MRTTWRCTRHIPYSITHTQARLSRKNRRRHHATASKQSRHYRPASSSQAVDRHGRAYVCRSTTLLPSRGPQQRRHRQQRRLAGQAAPPPPSAAGCHDLRHQGARPTVSRAQPRVEQRAKMDANYPYQASPDAVARCMIRCFAARAPNANDDAARANAAAAAAARAASTQTLLPGLSTTPPHPHTIAAVSW